MPMVQTLIPRCHPRPQSIGGQSLTYNQPAHIAVRKSQFGNVYAAGLEFGQAIAALLAPMFNQRVAEIILPMLRHGIVLGKLLAAISLGSDLAGIAEQVKGTYPVCRFRVAQR